MKAIHLTAYGNPAQNLRMVEVSEPNAPSASEALVRMEYAPINYSDLLLANGVYFLNPKLPSVIGGEGAGIVETIGPGVTSVKVGDRVWASSWPLPYKGPGESRSTARYPIPATLIALMSPPGVNL
jgi:NADPH:quinone reductase-like Zn-dependent oxidoreductase